MQLFNICTKREYEVNGDKKIKWYKIGVLKITDGQKKYIRLYHAPQTELYVFDREELSPETESMKQS